MRKQKIRLAVFEIFMILVVLVLSYPLLMIVNMSLQTDLEVTLSPLKLPQSAQWQNYKEAFTQMNYLSSAWNSFVITMSSTAVGTILYCMASYAIVRAPRWKKFFKGIYILFIIGMILPAQSTLIPLVWAYSKLHLTGSYVGMDMLYVAGAAAFSIMLVTGFINTVPISLEESARLDGCTPYGIFFKIMFPLMKPIISTLIIINAINIWNDFYNPLFFLSGKSSKTITLAVYMFRGEHMTQWNILFAGLVLATLPMMLLYFALQKYIIAGMASGAVKS